MEPIKIYEYLMKTRERVLDAVRPLAPTQYQHECSFGLKTIGATLAHIMLSEWYYIERFDGRTVPPYEQWPIQYEHPPSLDVIERTWREQATRIRATIAAERDWNRPVAWLGFPDEAGRRFHIVATAGDLFTQLALHEVHHRAQLMAMLRELGTPLEDLDYNALMFERREAT
ncbi:MAG: DinB family protein [Phycisphaerales bacterium]